MLRHQATNKVLKHPINDERLKRYVDRRDFSAQPVDSTANASQSSAPHALSQAPTTGNLGDEWYPVNKLLAGRERNGQKFFRVEWEDKNSKPSRIHEDDVTDSLKRAFYVEKSSSRRQKRRGPKA